MIRSSLLTPVQALARHIATDPLTNLSSPYQSNHSPIPPYHTRALCQSKHPSIIRSCTSSQSPLATPVITRSQTNVAILSMSRRCRTVTTSAALRSSRHFTGSADSTNHVPGSALCAKRTTSRHCVKSDVARTSSHEPSRMHRRF